MGNMFKCALKQGGSGGSGADLIVTCSAEFAGATITASKTGSTSQTQTCPSTSPYVVTFSGLDNGTWTVSGTISGQTYSVQATITDFSAILEFDFNWQEWLDSAQYLDSSDYNDLDEVLEDEEALRELFLEHNCVDYLADVSTASANVTKILNTDLAAKWINDSDYALDTLSANAEIKAVMDEADKYGYGEWVIVDNTTTPPTWGAKGCVPVMTANTAPYGTVSASSEYSSTYQAYKAFDNDASTTWRCSNTTVGNKYSIQYKFANPTCIKRVLINKLLTTTNPDNDAFVVYGSNDGSNWTAIANGTAYADAVEHLYDADNNDYYLYIKVEFTATVTNTDGHITAIQFYGRQLTVSVPVMTGNTAPFGEVASGSEATNYDAYKVFDNDASTIWLPVAGSTEDKWYIQYKFGTKMCARMVAFQMPSSYQRIKEFEIQGSNDGTTWETVFTQAITPSANLFVFDFANIDGYDYCRFRITDQTDRPSLIMLQFYGLDYSEKEFEVGSNKKWLYDHGVELETMTTRTVGTNAVARKDDSELYFEISSSSSFAGFCTELMDLTNYSLLRAKVGDTCVANSNVASGTLSIFNTATPTYNTPEVAYENVMPSNSNLPNNKSLDISSLNTNYSVSVCSSNASSSIITRKQNIKELWLE